MSLEILFQQYVQHGIYLRGWSPKTVAIFQRVLRNFQQSQDGSGELSKPHLEAWVAWMRQQNRSATYINIHVRALNAFLSWAHAEEHLPKRLKLKQVPNPQKVLPAISDAEVSAILNLR